MSSFSGFLLVASVELDFPKWLGVASPFENGSLACPDSAPTRRAWACRTLCVSWEMTELSGSGRGRLETHCCLFFLIDVRIPWACPEHGLRASGKNEGWVLTLVRGHGGLFCLMCFSIFKKKITHLCIYLTAPGLSSGMRAPSHVASGSLLLLFKLLTSV